MAKSDWIINIESLVTGLLTIEINTIEKPGILAQKMPILPVALHQVAEAYDLYLLGLGYGVTACLLDLSRQHLDSIKGKQSAVAIDDTMIRGWKPDDHPVDRRDLKIDRQSFEALRWAAEACLRDARKLGLTSETEAIVARIRTNCRQLGQAVLALRTRWQGKDAAALLDGTIDDIRQQLLQKPQMVVPVDSDILVLVRKMWDLGTATVLMQTSIQVDGDAANLLSPDLTGGRHDFTLNAHQRVVEIALAQWKSLFQLAVSLATDVVKAF